MLSRFRTTDGLDRAAARCAVIAVAMLGTALLTAAGEVAATLSPRARVDDLVVVGVAATGAAACWWLTLVTIAAAVAPRRWRPAIAAATPAVWRRVIAVALGTVVAAGAALPASAAGWVAHTPEEDPSPVGWLAHASAIDTNALPAEAIASPGPATSPATASPPAFAPPMPTPTQESPTAPSVAQKNESSPHRSADATHTVSRGQSLWTITAMVLDTRDAHTIAAAWPALYEANRDALGSNPHLIHPGQTLTLPRKWSR